MSYKLKLEKDAILDIQEAFRWYEEQKEDLGYHFLGELETCYQKICEYPEYYSAINSWLRRIKVSRFPYVVIYEIEEEFVIINAIRHMARRPKY